jgi:hypothetical protein
LQGGRREVFTVVTAWGTSYIARMKIRTLLNSNVLWSTLAFCLLGCPAFADSTDATALSLIKEANRYVGDDVKDKVVQIYSEKSVGTLLPNIWYVVFYDQDATFKTAVVKFGAGRKLEVKHPMRPPFQYINVDKVFDQKKLKTDSDQAIKIATAEPLLDKLTIKATQLWLEYSDQGPRWKVRLWAAKLRNPSDMADIGDVYITAEDGKVVRNDLHIDRVD